MRGGVGSVSLCFQVREFFPELLSLVLLAKKALRQRSFSQRKGLTAEGKTHEHLATGHQSWEIGVAMIAPHRQPQNGFVISSHCHSSLPVPPAVNCDPSLKPRPSVSVTVTVYLLACFSVRLIICPMNAFARCARNVLLARVCMCDWMPTYMRVFVRTCAQVVYR